MPNETIESGNSIRKSNESIGPSLYDLLLGWTSDSNYYQKWLFWLNWALDWSSTALWFCSIFGGFFGKKILSYFRLRWFDRVF